MDLPLTISIRAYSLENQKSTWSFVDNQPQDALSTGVP